MNLKRFLVAIMLAYNSMAFASINPFAAQCPPCSTPFGNACIKICHPDKCVNNTCQ